MEIDETIESLTEQVIASAIEVHRRMGPGLNEGIYAESMMIELTLRDIPFEADVRINVSYKGRRLRRHQAQVITYLGLTNISAGLSHPDVVARRSAPLG